MWSKIYPEVAHWAPHVDTHRGKDIYLSVLLHKIQTEKCNDGTHQKSKSYTYRYFKIEIVHQAKYDL